MWTQRDQLQAYQFLRRRLVSALQMGDANHPTSPSRRVIVGTVLGTVLALLVAGGFGIYGLLKSGVNQDWRKAGQVVIEKETGAAFVLDKGGLLHPMINYTSARLFAGGEGKTTVTVSAKSLANAARGVPLGITGAPNSVPTAANLVSEPWAVCSAVNRNLPATSTPDTTVMVGVRFASGELDAAHALIVKDPNGGVYALIGGRRFKIADDQVLVALGFAPAQKVPVSLSWINAVPPGPDFRLIQIPSSGERASFQVGGVRTNVGEVVFTELDGVKHFYLVRKNSLSVITATEATLVVENPKNKQSKQRKVSNSDISESVSIKQETLVAEYPANIPQPINQVRSDQATICGASGPAGDMTIHIYDRVPLPSGAKPITITDQSDQRLAGAAFVPPGMGVVVRMGTGTPIGTVYLITDQGIRYPIPGEDAMKALGYGAVTPVQTHEWLLTLFPLGPVLDPEAAGRPPVTAAVSGS